VQSLYLEPGSVIRIGSTLLLFGEIDPVPEDFVPDWEFYGYSRTVREVLAAVQRVAATDLTVLLLGESGTGKEVLARRIHAESGRRGAFVAVNCAAVAPNLVESTFFGHVRGAFTGATRDHPGMFAAARGGTLFLDEVGELPLDLQAKFLRVLENHEFIPVGSTRTVRTDARIVAATNRDLRQMVEQGRFRLDLLARLQGFLLEIKPLRERREDVLPLAERFLQTFAPERTFEWTPDFAEALLLHPWPMNVRELRALVERIVLLVDEGGKLRVNLLPDEMRRRVATRQAQPTQVMHAPAPPMPIAGGRGRPDRDELLTMLELYEGNIAQVAEHYRKDRKQIYRWLRYHGIDLDAYRDRR